MQDIHLTQQQFDDIVCFFAKVIKISENLSTEQKLNLCTTLIVLTINSVTDKNYIFQGDSDD